MMVTSIVGTREDVDRRTIVDDTDGDDSGGGGESCDWDQSICDESPSYYMTWFCDDTSCALQHRHTFCTKHYALRLIRLLDHLSECEAYDDCETPEDRRRVTLDHVVAWGSLS